MSSQSSGGVPIVEKGEVHTESIQQPQPIDLAHHGPTVVQLRPVRTFGQIPHGTMKPAAGQATVGSIATVAGTPIISVNRTGTGPNLTILPARGAGTPGGAATQIPAYLARGIVGNVRSSLSGHQPGSITVTPISSSNFGANIRLTTPVNNGTWIQSSSNAQGQYTPLPLRAATITVSNRAVRPDGKMIHIPPGGPVQHVTQLQMVDNKGSILKPQITTTPIMNMRGTIHPQGSGNAGTPLTLAPITIRTTNLANINTIQQRPPNATTNTASHFDLSRVQKVITQPPHGPPLQILNAQKIQTITPLPRLNTVCLTISTHGNVAPNNTAPVVTMASRQGGTSLVMTPSIGAQVSTGNTLPITKVYPVSRDVTPVVETFFASPQVSSNTSTAAVTVNAIPLTAQSGSGSQSNVVIASSSTSNTHHIVPPHGTNNSHPHAHHVVQVHGPISVNSSGATVGVGIPQSSVPPGTMTPSFYHVDPKNLNMNLLQQQHSHQRPIAIEKRTVNVTSGDNKSIMAGSAVILTTQNQAPNQHHTQSVTFPLAAAHSAFPHIPMSHQQAQIIQTHPVLTPVSSVSCVANNIPQSQAQNVQIGHNAIPTHVISQPSPVTTSSSASISSTVAISSTSSVIVTTSVVQPNSSASVSFANSTACSAAATTASSNSMQTSTPAQSPSQTKSTLSPRPSILRKREAGDHNHHAVPSRAQRNLALNFSVSNPNVQVASASAAAAAAAAANKENSVVVSSVSLAPSLSSSQPLTSAALSSSGVSILKKEFQPPNEESSWQSCSSNSSSGSTTISTTSETAEIQMQQQQQSQLPINSPHSSHLVPTVTVGLPDLSVPIGNYGNISNMGGITGLPVSQNGIVRSVSGTSTSARPKATNKTNLKDLERVKGRQDKDDGVSPRKKPRKQQLTTSDLFDSASPEISFYQGKRFKKSELMDPKMFEEFNDRINDETAFEEAPVPRIAYYLKKPQMSLLQSNKFSSKPPHNHFQRYCDVKSKDERRPTVNDLLNQKNVIQKCNGWKLQHLNSQVEEIIEFEGDVVDRFTVLLNKLEAKVGPNSTDRDLNRIQELLKGNIQRGKVIRDQMLESKSQVLKILEHKPRVLDVINKYNSKRPIKKRERL
ncbi:unnamed protein product [Allacma fusca]|uniref:Histone deacetylase complex subunit SAP130 C-terminal domain-containing protein n=1 Tax=Allacma fusca TaxID=39272 RepID=A0A8J2JWF3_9HEXA|nr:unnamed protein product [Allacma fusca]